MKVFLFEARAKNRVPSEAITAESKAVLIPPQICKAKITRREPVAAPARSAK